MRKNKKTDSRLAMKFFSLPLTLILSMAFLATSCNEQEKSCLLQFLAGLLPEDGITMSWRDGSSTDCCKWEGIACNGSGSIIEISLASRSLEGSISPALGKLTGLLRLNLSYNSLSGGLPSELISSGSITVLDVSFNRLSGVLAEPHPSILEQPLQELNISSNLFTGQFPSTVWEKTRNLVAINASNNSFDGWMPSSFCASSSSFAVLDLSFNKFSGSIPASLGECSALRVFKAGYNNLSGLLPDELFNATSLEYLSFPSNGLYGLLDGAHIMNIRNLVNLDLGDNRLNGEMPDSIGQLKRLEELRLGNNNMSGELPSALSNCSNLIMIDLKYNNFSGELQKVNFSNLPNLKALDLLYNNFTGTVPESIYSCVNLIALRLSGNNLHGQLSPGIGNLKSLVFLSLGANNFTNITNTLQVLKNCRNLTFLLIGTNFKGEAMPQDETIDSFQNLRVLSITDCSLSGEIPLWLSKLQNLEMLFLNRNRLSGPIPPWIKNLNSLFCLDIYSNNLEGELPAALMEMPMLKTEKTASYSDPRVFELPFYIGSLQYRITSTYPKTLDFSDNNLTGVIPQEIVKLKSLEKLNFSFNSLSGEIPQQLSSLTNLRQLDLSSNHLTGAIPLALNNLHFLSQFNVSHNDLEGTIPTGGQLSTFPSSSFDGNPKLCGIIVDKLCGSAEAPPVSVHSTAKTVERVVFAIVFGLFFGVGVLYDQIVLSRYFG